MSGVYVYAVTRSDHPLRLDGLRTVGGRDDPPRVVVHGPLAAVVSPAPPGLRPKRRDLAAHQELQERLMADGSVLPMRFGLVAPDDTAVRTALEEHGQDYARRLGELHGTAEFNLKAARDQDDLLREVLGASEEARRLNQCTRDGTGSHEDRLALGELVARQVDARQRRQAEEIVGRLSGLARSSVLADPANDDFLNVSFLVERARAEEFTTAGRRMAHDYGDAYDFRLRGPLPPYSFAA
ncbi:MULTISPECIES: GvpL/GvpF family gas vesicle protein [Streptomyces]|uniref:Gas vesicle synthesis protein GvpL/GvpF n=1 Tax=Streptomyces chartreusis NRRL 3882 TaxID=1079985 RepID=A0A2N9B4N2_STRCX|nr:GvpL/GvpF family gas vesicle protein [Streptomyces chartreusis]MYS90732.1 gas vesicle protein [Streptomyces sp. SID5464]SOR78278.1 Gas vesicle synthesis protein GvpL/GvpF [Streptomyces chartreusis NRRL 3882]